MDRPLTLVFTDMVGSSAAKRAVSLGEDDSARDEAYLDAVQTRHLRLVRECLAAHRGKEIMTIGDAFFLTFDNPRAALLCCAEIQMRLKAAPIMTGIGPLRLRIGIHCGYPKFFENSWHGTDVDTATRAESVGAPEQIVLTEAARKQLAELSAIQLRPLGTFALKGVGDVALWDADYDRRGLRKPQVASIEQMRRQARIAIAWRVGYGALAACLVLAGFLFYRHRQSTRITTKDKLILADFDNKTGDPVFDATLKEALSIQLEQSPLLQLIGDEEIHADLKYLRQPTEQRITPALAREIGQREGVKAYITASVANIGTSYVVSVDAVNCATGDPIARAQAEAADKNHVLNAVSSAASTLREKLGESLASVQKLSTPFLNDVTTSSLEAFHAFSLGEDAHRRGSDPEAIVFYKQAIDLDPSFAMAYARVAIAYSNSGRATEAIEQMTRAYAMREHATERERMYITAELYSLRGDLPNAISAFQTLLVSYPNDVSAINNLAITYEDAGNYPKTGEYFKQIPEKAPWDIAGLDNLAQLYLQTGDVEAARKLIERSAAVSSGNDTNLLVSQAVEAFETGNPAWKTFASAGLTRPDGFVLDQAIADFNFMQGSLAAGRALAEQGFASAIQNKSPDGAGNVLAGAAFMLAEYNVCAEVPAMAKRALAVDASVQTVPDAAVALALCGQGERETAALRKLAEAFPDNTLLNAVYLPEAEAAIALRHGKYEAVPGLLQTSHPYPVESGAPLIEAQALLELHRPAEALALLEPVLRYRYNETLFGINGQLPSYGMATLLAGRAEAMAGDKAAAATMYRQAIAVWQEADPGFKPLADARKELAALHP
jgi:class 3 adenylate cyclase/tetratricopeptide (TPR) repeat protein